MVSGEDGRERAESGGEGRESGKRQVVGSDGEVVVGRGQKGRGKRDSKARIEMTREE